jgi:hypothetical protein
MSASRERAKELWQKEYIERLNVISASHTTHPQIQKDGVFLFNQSTLNNDDALCQSYSL